MFNKNGSFTFGNQSTEKFVAYELDINVFEEKLKKKFYETNVLHHELAQQKDLLTNMDVSRILLYLIPAKVYSI